MRITKSSTILIAQVFIFLLYIFFLLKSVGSYGYGVDETVNRNNGVVSWNYVHKKLETLNLPIDLLNRFKLTENTTHLNDYQDKDYGVAFDLSVLFIERLLQVDDVKSQFHLRKIIVHLFFMLSAYALYKIAMIRFNHFPTALLATVIFASTPRLFGESFYNSKDIVFMSVYVCSFYVTILFFNKKNIKSAILLGFISAYATDIRIIGVSLLAISFTLMFLEIRKDSKAIENCKLFLLFIIYLLSYVFFVCLLWPWLWEDPAPRFVEAFHNMARFRLIRWELFKGIYYPSSKLPWYYLFVWISITTPISYFIFFILGCLRSVFCIWKYKLTCKTSVPQVLDSIFLYILFIPILLSIFFHSVLYNGWRHFYFVYPFFILLCASGLYSTIKSKFYYAKYFLIFILMLNISSNIYWIKKNYPLEYIYFNILAGRDWNANYPGDYASLAVSQGLQYILDHSDSEYASVAGGDALAYILPKYLPFLKVQNSRSISVVGELENPDYLLIDYQYFEPEGATLVKKVRDDKFRLIHHITVNKIPVLSIFENSSNAVKSP